MKNKLSIFFYLLVIICFSCDDRIPDENINVESGSISVNTQFISGSTTNPVIVGEVLSNPQTSIIVIARLLNNDGEGVNGKSLQFSAEGVTGSFDTNDPTTKYVPNFKEYDFPNLGGNGYAMARFTPDLNQNKIATASSSGALIKIKYTDDIIENTEFSVFGDTAMVWPYNIYLSSEDQVDLGEITDFEVLLENAYGNK